MIQFSKKDKDKVLKAIKEGNIDVADVSFPNLIDTIILEMRNLNLLNDLDNAFTEKRKRNLKIPLNIIFILAITAKMKLKTSLTDIPFAITDSELLSEIGWNIWDNDRDIESGL